MTKRSIEPVCNIEIVDQEKVEFAKGKLADIDQILQTANLFKLIGEPSRLKILLSLFDNELCVCDLAATSESTISAVSHQLRLLRNARLVKFRKEGKMIYYSLEDCHIKTLIEQAKEHLLEK
jgi:ArsR family transcriptional regulator